MEGDDALNSTKPDLGHKTGYCGPQGAKMPKIHWPGRMYVRMDHLAFRKRKSQSYEIRNLSFI